MLRPRYPIKMEPRDPTPLFEQCLCSYVSKLNYNVSTLNNVQKLRYLPTGVLIDVYLMMSQDEDLHKILFEQLSDMNVFARLLRLQMARQKLFRCVAALMGSGKQITRHLQQNFTLRYQQLKHKSPEPVHDGATSSRSLRTASNLITPAIYVPDDKEGAAKSKNSTEPPPTVDVDDDEHYYYSDAYFGWEAVDLGMRLGSFLSESGWITESIEVLKCVVRKLRHMGTDTRTRLVYLDCLGRLLHSKAALCSFKAAERTVNEMKKIINEMSTKTIPNSLLATTYTEFSIMYFARSEYDHSHTWSVLALQHLNESTPERIAVDVLRQAAKSCVVKRDFKRAYMLISQACHRARKFFGIKHQKYADTLLDYGFFLLNVDHVYQSVLVYRDSLEIKRLMFGNRNFHVAIAHEDISYAYYVHEYSTGNFTCARDNVEKAVAIMKELVPHDHLMLASAKRVKALLLEEIALDRMSDGGADEDGLLKQSEELHNYALKLSLEVFGEVNVQTAKHYGNLGRLYQTMSRFEEAERMHKKAIQIKTDLLGPFDYEVGLSIGHLASLYNYQMKKYRDAEKLYERSIEISVRLFGPSYSGLEYDYLGLCNVYENISEFEKYVKYANILENWQSLRGRGIEDYPYRANFTSHEVCPLSDLVVQFFDEGSKMLKCTCKKDLVSSQSLLN